MKDSKEILFKIVLSEDDFNISSSIEVKEDTFDTKDKTLLLIALHQIKENILNNTLCNSDGVVQ